MRQFSLVILLMCIGTRLQAQTGKLSGRVVDAQTLQPLPFTNVYVNNTTIGTTTNATGEFVLSTLPVGSTDLVFSFLGYVSQQLTIMVRETANAPLTIPLKADAQQVSEVVVKASRDKTWEKQLKRFENVFLGTTANCKILNPWVIDFTDNQGVTTAKAALPLEIENRRLGYTILFQLKRLSYSPTEFSIVGTTRFTELETTRASEALQWTKNREQAYRGSAKHLMKAILDRQLNQQGFGLYRDKDKGKPRSKYFSAELDHNLIPYDTTSFVTPGSSIHAYRIAINQRMEVHYMHDFVTPSYYTDVSDAVSWLEVRGGSVLVNQEGTILNPTDVAISGNMADARVSGMLPLDYKPGSFIRTQAPTNRLARRLQENVYLHTDKPYYYPGDPIWFSAYMNYRVPGLSDTLSRVLYVDLIDADRLITQTRILPIDRGRAAGSFLLPAVIKPGNYVLRAHTQWMSNYGIELFFYKPIPILSLDQRVDATPTAPVSDHALSITFDRPVYTKRSKVTMTLGLDTTGLDAAVTGSFSVAVFDETLTIPVDQPVSIKTAFILSDPPKDMPPAFSYPIEHGLTIHGMYTDKKGKGKKANITLVPENFGRFYPVATDNHGEFSVPNVVFYDSTKFVVQPADGHVSVINRKAPDLPEKLPVFIVPLVPTHSPRLSYSWDTLNTRLLAEVAVSAPKIIRSENSYAHPDFYIKGESMESYATVADAIAAKLPAFKLVYGQTNWLLIWARSSVPNSKDLAEHSDLSSHEPNLYINNVLVVGETAGDRLMSLNPTLIDHIEVNGMISSNQGANGSNGLINVFTKRSTPVASRPLSIVTARGYDRELRFRSPTYDSLSIHSTAKDFRSTLYWNPQVNLTAHQAPVVLSFFTSDLPGIYRVVVEGVTNKGTTIHSEATLTIKD